MEKTITSWGRVLQAQQKVIKVDPIGKNYSITDNKSTGLPVGNLRSYGDVCLNPDQILWDMKAYDHLISFDPVNGVLRCEAGILLSKIQEIMIPQGWMLPVTPGTQLITVGGAIANDVHGKNHHLMGSFGDHVLRLNLWRTNGEVIACSQDENSEWLEATIGGFGLTGVIEQADIKLRKIEGPWLEAENRKYENLESFFSLSDGSEENWEHTVSWVDCLSGKNTRGVFLRGNHVYSCLPLPNEGVSKSVPFIPPISCINRWTLRPFNEIYFRLEAAKRKKRLIHYKKFFYPLDNLLNWNRIYGPQGFFQYQSVIPFENAAEATKEMMNTIRVSGQGSFLAVLKKFGNRKSKGLMSFPMPGVTLALDFPNMGSETLRLFDRLDAIVSEAGGRLYVAKDGRMPKALFESGYPALNTFLKFRDHGISSSLSRRLIGN